MTKNAVYPPRPPPPTNTPDADLIQDTLKGNKASFDVLILKYQPAIFLMIQRHLRHREEAEDVSQQVFVKAFQHLSNFRGEAKFFTWLYTIALNLIRNHVRQRKLRRTESIDFSEQGSDRPVRQWPGKEPSPEKVAQDRWDLERVVSELERLIEPHRTIFTLHYFQHLSLKLVALRVHRPIGTVKVYLHRARKMILSRL